MTRQRLRAHDSPLRFLGRVVLVLALLAPLWYGAMLVALALKVSPDAIDTISGYRTAFDFLADLEPDDVDGTMRLIAALSGVAALLVFGYLAWKEIPRPYLSRSDAALRTDGRGALVVEPRAIERAAEVAASAHPWVSEARARYGDDEVTLDVRLDRTGDVAAELRAVQRRTRESLNRHGLPAMPVNVELAGFERKRRRELA